MARTAVHFLAALFVILTMSGCTLGYVGGKLSDRGREPTHRVSEVTAAYLLPSGMVVICVMGKKAGDHIDGRNIAYSISVPVGEIAARGGKALRADLLGPSPVYNVSYGDIRSGCKMHSGESATDATILPVIVIGELLFVPTDRAGSVDDLLAGHPIISKGPAPAIYLAHPVPADTRSAYGHSFPDLLIAFRMNRALPGGHRSINISTDKATYYPGKYAGKVPWVLAVAPAALFDMIPATLAVGYIWVTVLVWSMTK